MVFSRIFPRLLVFTGILLGVAVGGTIFLVQSLEKRVRSQVDLTARLFSALLTIPSDQAFPAEWMDEVLSRLDFPIVITTPKGIPQAWRNIPGIEESPTAIPFRSLPEEEQRRIMDIVREAQHSGWWVPLSFEGFNLGILYFTPPPLLRVARLLPFVLLGVGLLSFAGMAWSARTLSDAYVQELWALFAKGLAHQMGTPLSSLMGWLEHLRESPENLEEILEEMEKDLEDLRQISLRFSRIGQPPAFQAIPLDREIPAWLDQWKRRWLREVEIQLSLEPAWVQGDAILLRWVLENLVKNAYEACGRGCTLSIQLYRDGSWVHLQVIDKGPGIPEDVQKQMFNIHISTKPRGWGMGLWVARKIVEDWHHGKIRLVESQPGHTVFEITIRGWDPKETKA